jgi:hypothetical protein
MMDVVYLCRNGENEELRYSLRSLKNIDHGRVWVFGGAPAWLTGVEFVETDQSGVKRVNTHAALKLACAHPDISDEFILMNDDFFIVESCDIPVAHMGSLTEAKADYAARYPNSNYTQWLNGTAAVLTAQGIDDPLSYELHIPMVFDKALLGEILTTYDTPGLLYRTIYGNLLGIGGVQMADVKVYDGKQAVPHGPFISSVETSFPAVEPVLRYLLPDESPHYDAETARIAKLPPLRYPVPLARNKEPFEFNGRMWRGGDQIDRETAVAMKAAGILTDPRIV